MRRPHQGVDGVGRAHYPAQPGKEAPDDQGDEDTLKNDCFLRRLYLRIYPRNSNKIAFNAL